MKVALIPSPLPGEHIAATAPVMRPETDDAGWRLRLNFWAGRALTAEALELEQENRAAALAWRGRLATTGIVTGLEAALEAPSPPPERLSLANHFLHILPGFGLLAGGEDIVVPRPLRVPLDQIPVNYVRIGDPESAEPDEPAPPGATAGERQDAGGFVYHVDSFASGHVPWAAVLVVSPAEVGKFAGVDPENPCELDPSRDAFADERRLDACEVRLCQLPVRWESLPLLTDRSDPRWRNRLAHVLLAEEAAATGRNQIRLIASQPAGRRWDTVLREAGLFPWELLGVPLALLSSEAGAGFYLDRSAVARQGGLARPRVRPALRLATEVSPEALDPPGAGTPANWRARVDQFTEQLGQLDTTTEAGAEAAAERFQFAPAAGMLPRTALTFLTTDQALALPHLPDRPPDRAGISHFFPASFSVDAVPVAVEDLDAAVASSAPLVPVDLTSADAVRVLVPLPQSVFDPKALVVEQEDPVFAETVARFIARRQDWRQRRDFVRSRRVALDTLDAGPKPSLRLRLLEYGQQEPEPVETVAALGFTAALLSPVDTVGPWEASVDFAESLRPAGPGEFVLLLRVDEDSMPSRIEVRWRTAAGEYSHVWNEPPAAFPEQLDANGQPLASPLWRRFSVAATDLGPGLPEVTGFTLHLGDGRAALAAAVYHGPISDPYHVVEISKWSAQDAAPAPRFNGGAWERIDGDRLLAPFEDVYVAEFPDGRSVDQRVAEVEGAINPSGVTPRAAPMSVAANGLDRVLTELDSEADEADDFVDTNFTRAQVNLYRIRKLILGETAAQKLLINPAIASIAEQETAAASAEQLGAFLNEAKKKTVQAADVNKVLNPQPAEGVGTVSVEIIKGAVATYKPVNEFFIAPEIARTFTAAAMKSAAAAESRRQIVQQLPESGPALPPRGLSIGERFKEPDATQNLSYARAALTDLLNKLTRLRLPMVDQSVRSISGEAVSLLELQGRVVAPATPPGTTSESLRTKAVETLLKTADLTQNTDEAEITLAALDFTEIKTAILRTIEAVIQQRRAIVATGQETLGGVRGQRDAAAGRILVIEGKLAEARQDVSVARALRQEEQQRVAEVNSGRDALIRDEVKFLAYVRPRSVDPVRRATPYWKLEAADAPAPLPACLRRHDEPPQALKAYLHLFPETPARWFTALAPLLEMLDTSAKLAAVLDMARLSAPPFAAFDAVAAAGGAAEAVLFTVYGAQQVVASQRRKAAVIDVGDVNIRRWTDFRRDAEEFAAVGDLIRAAHGAQSISVAAARELEQIAQVSTCLHAEFAAVAPAIRLAWVERFSQFDQPARLRDLTVLPYYGRLDREMRRRLQQFADWLFGRVKESERDAVNLINDLVRLCLLLASHAPVNRIIAGHLARPMPVSPGIRIPIQPSNPELVRVGMQFQVWQASRVVASGTVEDLQTQEIRARVDKVDAQVTTLDTTMQVQFVSVTAS